MKIGLIQLDSGDDVEANLSQAEASVRDAAERGAEFIVLPEVMHLRVGPALSARYAAAAEPIPGPTTERFGALANELGVYLLLGSMGEASDDPTRTYNTSVLIEPGRSVLARYRKLHLFDVSVDDETGDRESDRYLPGDEVISTKTRWGRVGLTICYDLRFAELYRTLALQGARVVFVPANFTKATGEAHWMMLLRARAIENGLFIVAPAQCGRFLGGFEAFGHSTVIDPWGRVLVEHDDAPGVSLIELDLNEVDRVRQAIPVLHHLRSDVYRVGLSD